MKNEKTSIVEYIFYISLAVLCAVFILKIITDLAEFKITEPNDWFEQPISEEMEENTVFIPFSDGKSHLINTCYDYYNNEVNHSCGTYWEYVKEIPLKEALQLLIDYEGLKYVPEETNITEAKLTK